MQYTPQKHYVILRNWLIMFIKVCHWSLFWASCIQSKHS